MTLDEVVGATGENFLEIFGAFHPEEADEVPMPLRTLVLLGPKEPGFWAHFTESEEAQDGRADPLDRWSQRVIENLAKRLNAKAFFPFGGPPWQPFVRWAQASGRAHVSPVGLLIHDQAGLMVSYRGALGFEARMDLPETGPSPCYSCENKPCLTACPVDAFAGDGYDVAGCKTDLERAGNDCLSRGCAVRRACPVSQKYGRREAQSSFHMAAFR